MVRLLIGYILMYAAFDAAGRLLDGLGLAWGKSLAAGVGIAAALVVQWFMHGERGMPALRRLGWGLPDARVLGIAVAVSGALLASMPFIFRLAGVDLIVPSNWLLLSSVFS
jgi:hypothetical protein